MCIVYAPGTFDQDVGGEAVGRERSDARAVARGRGLPAGAQ